MRVFTDGERHLLDRARILGGSVSACYAASVDGDAAARLVADGLLTHDSGVLRLTAAGFAAAQRQAVGS